jgi:hypothetical protein
MKRFWNEVTANVAVSVPESPTDVKKNKPAHVGHVVKSPTIAPIPVTHLAFEVGRVW